jgi:hypothetical protein
MVPGHKPITAHDIKTMIFRCYCQIVQAKHGK